ncbi:MAG: hypothetical protein HFJ22_07210 [Clostridia bacterium]|jgi:integrase|nr:hypothetical protein [Clostridia bacterium]
MESQFVISQLETVAASITQIEQQHDSIKNTLRVLFGYLRADTEFTIPIQGGTTSQQTERETEKAEVLEFTEQEISKMPKQFRTIFKTDGVRAHVRKRTRNNSISYEIRFRADGYNISASGLTVAEAKVRFIQKLHDARNGIKPTAPDVPKTFDKFVFYYFEKFRKRKVNPKTYTNDLSRMKKHIISRFGNIPIKNITPPMCQDLIDDIVATGKGKTAEEVFSLLNGTFKTAIKHNLIVHNPLDIVIHDKHEREHGKALTVEEEKYLLQTAAEPFKTIFAIMLFTGIRPNEYETVQIVGDMIHANNSKRHGGKRETKRIPITPMLKRYLSSDSEIPKMPIYTIRRAFNSIIGDKHVLYDMRTTFYTRCKMCGVAAAARDEFVGHSSGILGNTYTDLPDDYLIKEGQKLDY